MNFRGSRNARTTPDAGSSLAELIIVLAIFGSLTAIALALVMETYRSVQGQLSATTLYDTGSTALMQMTREIRMAGYPSTKAFGMAYYSSHPGVVATPFVIATPYHLVIQAAISGNGPVQQIDYSVPGGTTLLQRTVTPKNLDGTLASAAATSTVMLTGVQNAAQGKPLFTWDTDPCSPQPFPLSVRTIYINLVVQSNGTSAAVPVPVVLTAACPRLNF